MISIHTMCLLGGALFLFGLILCAMGLVDRRRLARERRDLAAKHALVDEQLAKVLAAMTAAQATAFSMKLSAWGQARRGREMMLPEPPKKKR